jgi:hypothetical protein
MGFRPVSPKIAMHDAEFACEVLMNKRLQEAVSRNKRCQSGGSSWSAAKGAL